MNESITVFLGEALREELDAAAQRYHRPRSEIMRASLIHFLETGKGEGESEVVTSKGTP